MSKSFTFGSIVKKSVIKAQELAKQAAVKAVEAKDAAIVAKNDFVKGYNSVK